MVKGSPEAREHWGGGPQKYAGQTVGTEQMNDVEGTDWGLEWVRKRRLLVTAGSWRAAQPGARAPLSRSLGGKRVELALG